MNRLKLITFAALAAAIAGLFLPRAGTAGTDGPGTIWSPTDECSRIVGWPSIPAGADALERARIWDGWRTECAKLHVQIFDQEYAARMRGEAGKR